MKQMTVQSQNMFITVINRAKALSTFAKPIILPHIHMPFLSIIYKTNHQAYTIPLHLSTSIEIMNSKEWGLQLSEEDIESNIFYTDEEGQQQIKGDENWQLDEWDSAKKQDYSDYSHFYSDKNAQHSPKRDSNSKNKLEYNDIQDEINELYPERLQQYQEQIHHQPRKKHQNSDRIQIQTETLDAEDQSYQTQQKANYKKPKVNRNPRNQTYSLDDQVLEGDDRLKLASRVKELFDKHNEQTPTTQSKNSKANKDKTNPHLQFRQRKKRTPITRQMIQKLKVNFQHYVSTLMKPYNERMTFREISHRIGISTTEVKHLYDEYSKDPLFMSRMSKFNQGTTLTRITSQFRSNAHSHAITERRMHFMSELIKRNGFLTQRQIAQQMSKVESLHQLDTNGQKMPITRKIIQHLMRVAKLFPKHMQAQVLNINTPEAINNRFRYATRYLELTQQHNSDIYFMGEFSFANNQSLSSCSPLRRQNFCSARVKANSKADKSQMLSAKSEELPQKFTKSLQYLMIMSLQGVVYYQLFNNMFEEIDFSKSVLQIGKTLSEKNPKMKKYLVLETSFLHRRNDLLNLEKTHNVKILFLPPQTPMLNPTEYLFGEIRTVTKSKAYKYKKSISSVLIEVLDMMKDKTMSSYYSCIRPYIKLALLKQPFK